MLGEYIIFSISICFNYLLICYSSILVIIIIFSPLMSCKDITKKINLMSNSNMGRVQSC